MTAPAVSRLLMLEPDARYAERVGAMLRAELGASVELRHAATLEAALQELRAAPADVVLHAGEPDDETVDALRRAMPCCGLVALVADPDVDLVMTTVRLGLHDALRKGEEDAGRLAATVREAAERSRSQAAVLRATATLTGVVDHAPDHVFVKDLDGRYALVNAAWSRAWGLLSDDVIGRTDAELFSPRQARAFAETDRRALDAGGPYRFETEHEGRAYAMVKFPVLDESGAVVGVGGISSDVSAIAATHAALDAERAHRQLVLENLPGTAVVLLDTQLRVVVVEGELARRRGHEPEALVGRHVAEAWPKMRARLGEMHAVLAGEECRFAMLGDDGFRGAAHAVPQRNAEGAVEGVLLLVQDVTAARAAEAAHAQAQRLFESAFATSPIGMAVTRLDGTYETVNRALLEMLGRDSLDGVRWQDVSHPDDAEADAAAARAALLDGDRRYRREKRYRHADGHDIWVDVTAMLLRDADGEPYRWFAQVLDITERKRFEARLERMVHHDELTGLLNRRGFERALADHLARMRRYGGDAALVLLDLDDFKVVNDTLGHRAGDDLVISAATALAGRLRSTDILARLGGDEFAVLLPASDLERAVLVAESLCDAVRSGAAVTTGARRRGITASAGVAPFSADGRTGEALLVEADLAMYDAKEQGRNRVSVAGVAPGAGPLMSVRVAWLDRLKEALENEAFVLHAQPVFCLTSGAVHHHELLIRLPDGQGGLVPPAEFLPIAERAGLIAELDRWVVRSALRVLADERTAGRPRRFSVNLSARSIGDEAVLAEFEWGLRQPGADASDLLVELTETAAIGDVDRAQRFTERLRDLGVMLSLDDFGVGFGSLYELKHLPCDEVKVDGEFIRGCATGETDRLVVASLVALARQLGKRTVAEFVHDEATAAAVREMGVDLGQGFHLGRPVPLEEALASPPVSSSARG